MFLLQDGTLVHSATDLAAAAACEFALLRQLDVRLGRIDPLELPEDAVLERTARLGDAHEARVLGEHLDRYGPWDPASGRGVAQISRPEAALATDRAALVAKREETLEVLRTGADVVFQAGFFDGRFGGWADFLVREPGGWAVYDTKLARHAKVTALLQLAAYADQLISSGLHVADQVHLILGDRSTTSHRLADLLPVFRDRDRRLRTMLEDHQGASGPVRWGDARYRACGRCPVCAPEVETHRDLLLVAGMRSTQRSRLHTAGITTVEDLAASDGPVEGIGGAALLTLRAQARLQSRPDGRQDSEVLYELFAPDVVGSLPPPDPGDIFFDFEGDPLWAAGGAADWGLEYLFGLVESPTRPDGEPTFRAFWAHDRDGERRALLDFLDYLADRRNRFPAMHVYHYAAYERTALLRLAGRHGVGEDVVDQLLRDGVLVDLYATVRGSLRVGQDSYSLKRLEALYMPQARSGEVTTAGDSIVEYAEACALRDAGQEQAWRERLDRIALYNADDCVSTLRLRDWLLGRAAEHGVRPAPRSSEPPEGTVASPEGGSTEGDAPEADPLADRLMAAAGSGTRTADQQAVALLAAALGYHWREAKPFWWAHFDRLTSAPEDWADRRGTMLVDEASVVRPWFRPAGTRTDRRHLLLAGQLDPGSELRPGVTAYALYDPPVPEGAKTSENGVRGWTEKVRILEVRAEPGPDGLPRDVLLVEDGVKAGEAPHEALPMAVVSGRPPSTDPIAAAVRRLAEQVDAVLPDLPDHPGLDVLRRIPPRTRSGAPLPPVDGEDCTAAIVGAVLDLDGSYLAVQGPPGTGKTYTGARVVAELVARGWRVGVTAQSHAVVENLLTGIHRAGVPAERIGKRTGTAGQEEPATWTALTDGAPFRRFHAQEGGYVMGGTAWDFTSAKRLPAAPLDLLVIDEAGQFALASTVAVAEAARSLLLLGDPQQLPQVSQGRHPEPVDRSALGWLADGHDTLPPELGYFLERTWRMHPALCHAVSRLSYEGRLHNMPCAAERSLDGVEPGVRSVVVEHRGNAVASTEEADEVVAQVRSVVGRRWRDPAAEVDRPLEPDDVVVVAAYNAQVWTVRQALDAAGLDGVRVGTVDRFQGQQAVVVVVTTAASSAEDVPRGMEFLLNRNRVNVAVSRGQWCAVVVRSAALTDHLPSRPAQLAELGAFLGLDIAPDGDAEHGSDGGRHPPVAVHG